jgi:pimeloyl-ACP methyl ester carboxylesterase
MLRAIAAAQVHGRLGRPERGAQAFLRWALGRRDGGNDLDGIPAEWRAAMLANARAIVAELRAGTGEPIERSRLGSLDLPVTVLVGGESDRVFGACARRLAVTAPGAGLREIPGAGHVMQHDRPDAIVTAVRAVLGAGPAGGGRVRAGAPAWAGRDASAGQGPSGD